MINPTPNACPCPAAWAKPPNGCNARKRRGLFGDAFVEHFAASRDWEERQSRSAVTDWQLQRYFRDYLGDG